MPQNYRYSFCLLLAFSFLSAFVNAQFPHDPLFRFQVNLHTRTIQNPTATNVFDAWENGMSGAGIVVSLVDRGFFTAHHDLRETMTYLASHNFVNDNINPLSHDGRATGLAGLIGANANYIDTIGVAYQSNLSGIKSNFNTDEEIAQALSFGSSSSLSTMGIDVYCLTFAGEDGFPYLTALGPLTSEALEKGARMGRGGKGSIYVVGSGTTSLTMADQNINFDGYASSPYTIAVGGIEGLNPPNKPGYHAYGSALLVVAPTATGNTYFTTLSATDGSSATEHFVSRDLPTAQVAGIVALILEANPDLSWFDVQDILISSASRILPSDNSWTLNGAAIWHSNKFGFGLVDALAAVRLARLYTPHMVTKKSQHFYNWKGNLVIPNDASVDTMYMGKGTVVNATFRVQASVASHVELFLTTNHQYSGDLEIELVSPLGTRSMLVAPHHLARSYKVSWVGATGSDVVETMFGPKLKRGKIHFRNLYLSSTDGCGHFPGLTEPFAAADNALFLIPASPNDACSFYDRALNAQKFGARLVLFLATGYSAEFEIMEEQFDSLKTGALVTSPGMGASMIQHINKGNLNEIIIEISESKETVPQYNDWRFLSYTFWRENAGGTWTVNLRDNHEDPNLDTEINRFLSARLVVHSPAILPDAPFPSPSPSPTPHPAPKPTPFPTPKPTPVPTPKYHPPPPKTKPPHPTPTHFVPLPAPTPDNSYFFMIVGGVIGFFVVVGGCLLGVLFYLKKKKSSKTKKSKKSKGKSKDKEPVFHSFEGETEMNAIGEDYNEQPEPDDTHGDARYY